VFRRGLGEFDKFLGGHLQLITQIAKPSLAERTCTAIRQRGAVGNGRSLGAVSGSWFVMLLDGRVLGIAMPGLAPLSLLPVLASLSLLPILLSKWLVEYQRHQQHTAVWHNPSQWVK
jgi:hypothetical protein